MIVLLPQPAATASVIEGSFESLGIAVDLPELGSANTLDFPILEGSIKTSLALLTLVGLKEIGETYTAIPRD